MFAGEDKVELPFCVFVPIMSCLRKGLLYLQINLIYGVFQGIWIVLLVILIIIIICGAGGKDMRMK